MSLAAHDCDIREPLFEFLERSCEKCRIIEEKQTGKARADAVLVLPDSLCGIEIKSDRDTYARLAGQVKYYDLYYDYNMVAVGSTHGLHIQEHVPEWWGILTVEETAGEWDFYLLRAPKRNPNVQPEKKLDLLWRRELVHILEKNRLPRYRERSKRFVQKKILEKVPSRILWQQVSEELFERDYTTIDEEIEDYREGKTAPGRL